jgi:Ca2+-transporting ATPase
LDVGNGLSTATASARLQHEGPNELPSGERRSRLRIVLEALRQPMLALLLGGGLVYLLLGDRVEALLLLFFASFSLTITVVQEARSESVLEALRQLASPRALVIRDGSRHLIPGREVVREDLLVLREGDRVAADAELLDSHDLLLDESLLTGESLPVPKRVISSDEGRVAGGTLVVRGHAVARVLATGAGTAIGRIGGALGGIATEQPHLQRQVQRLVRDFALFGAAAGLTAVLLFGLLRGSWLEALLSGIALGMSMLPEEFPLVLAVFMAMGAWRISRARVLTRRAAAIETLGATTVLCTDKTGTLTENRMSVAAIVAGAARWTPGLGREMGIEVSELLRSAAQACPGQTADPMDLAVLSLAAVIPQQGQRRLLHTWGLRADLFAVATLVDLGEGPRAFAKGAPEAIAELCCLSAAQRAALCAEADALAQAGMRVLGVASTGLLTPALTQRPAASPRGLPFEALGLLGFADPLRASAPAAVAECRRAGIRVVMLTGDYALTAKAIARQAGIEADTVLEGREIDGLSTAAFAARVRSTAVFARIQPQQKLRIVECLKADGQVVAMTGDGVNDAPAIKSAHIGIAMGGRGTDVAREASSLVLLDDDFSSIVATIRLGRRIYDNLRKATEYIVAVHIPIAGLALLPLLGGLPLMLTPIHIAFLEMVIDPACSVVLEAEQEEDDVMQRPPRDTASRLLPPQRLRWALLQGTLVLGLLATVLLTSAATGRAESELRALVFTALVLMNMGLILVNRSFSASLAGAFRRPNRSLWVLLGAVGGILAAALLWSPARILFGFGPLGWQDLLLAATTAGLALLLLEAAKAHWFRRAAG